MVVFVDLPLEILYNVLDELQQEQKFTLLYSFPDLIHHVPLRWMSDPDIRKQNILHQIAAYGNKKVLTIVLHLRCLPTSASIQRRREQAQQDVPVSERDGFEKEPSVNRKDCNGRTPVHMAAKHGHHEVIRLLLQQPDIKECWADNYGYTPLALAAENGHRDVIELLPHHYRHVLRSTTRRELSPLTLALQKGHKSVAIRLIELGTPVNHKNETDETPLSAATLRGYTYVVGMLLSRMTTEDDVDDIGRVPLLIAIGRRDADIVKLLIEARAKFGAFSDPPGPAELFSPWWSAHVYLGKLFMKRCGDKWELEDWAKSLVVWADANGYGKMVRSMFGWIFD